MVTELTSLASMILGRKLDFSTRVLFWSLESLLPPPRSLNVIVLPSRRVIVTMPRFMSWSIRASSSGGIFPLGASGRFAASCTV